MVTGEHKGLPCVLPIISFVSVLFVSGLEGQYLIEFLTFAQFEFYIV